MNRLIDDWNLWDNTSPTPAPPASTYAPIETECGYEDCDNEYLDAGLEETYQ